MKRILALAILISLLCALLSGCDFWMDGHYVSVTPYVGRNYHTEKPVVQASSSSQMRNALADFVENGTEKGIISVSSFNSPTVHFYMKQAIDYVLSNNPVGAYAVDNISFDIGTNTGTAAVAVNITYRHDRSEILRIKKSEQMGEALDVVYEALEDCQPAIAIYVNDYEPMDFQKIIDEYADVNPNVVMEIPKVSVNVYPKEGEARIVELIFSYQTSRETLRHMQELVAPVFTSAELYVQSEEQVKEKYSQLYRFLMERFEYTVVSSITPTYSLLLLGTGDAKAFATVYAAMCRRAGLECYVVTGTKDGEPWFWNLIYFRGGYYHLDLLECNQVGGFSYYKNTDMTRYEWQQNQYPDG